VNWIQVPEVSADAVGRKATISEAMRRRTPIVGRGFGDSLPAVHKWSDAFLRSQVGHREVELSPSFGASVRPRVATVADYLRLASTPQATDWYLTDWNFGSEAPSLLEDVADLSHELGDWLKALDSARQPDLLWMYIGHEGTKGPMHVDNLGTSAWLSVVRGTKLVRFCTPVGLSRRLRELDAFGPEAEGHESATGWSEVCLQAGDVLFIPSGVWHAACNRTLCVSVTGNYVAGHNIAAHRAHYLRGYRGFQMIEGKLIRVAELPDTERVASLDDLAEGVELLASALDDERAFLRQFSRRIEALRNGL